MWKPVVRSKFVEIKELILFSAVVISLFYFLYPKGSLEKLILNYKDSNLELANIYLENLVSINPDPNLKLLLAQRYSQIGDFQKAEKLLEELEKTELRDKAMFLRYERLKTLYFSTQNPDSKSQYYRKIKALLEEILSISNDIKVLESLYRESVSMDFPDLSLKVAKKLSQIKDDREVYWLKIVYKHAVGLKDYETALHYADVLARVDKDNHQYWLEEHYRIAIAAGKYDLAIKDIMELAYTNKDRKGKFKKDMVWLLAKDYPDYERIIYLYMEKYPEERKFLEDVLVQVYQAKKEYEKAYRLYLKLFNEAKSEKEKKELFVKITDTLLAQGNYDELKIFLQNNYKPYISDPVMAKLILKSALATGDPKFAYTIAKDIKEAIR